MPTTSPRCIAAHDPDLVRQARALLDEDGFVLVTDAYDASELAAIKHEIITIESAATREDKGYLFTAEGGIWAIWNMYERSKALMRLVLSPDVFRIVPAALGEPAEFCRATLMRKAPGTRHTVGWHQDAGIAVDRHIDDERALDIRDGVPHRVPTVEVMQRIMAARVNVDAQYADGGCLKVIPGSHRWGMPERKALIERAETCQPLLCPAPAGSVLFYHQLLVHSSSVSERHDPDNHRRVVHNEFYAASCMPGAPGDGLNWWPWRHTARVTEQGITFRVERSEGVVISG